MIRANSEASYECLRQRPEPPTTKKLSIVTLTRIFVLTNENQSLVRDITTPSLPNFVTLCLRLSKDSKGNALPGPNANDPVLSTVLWSIGKLLPQHPRTFKPFHDQIHALVLPLTAATPSALLADGREAVQHCAEVIAQRARHVFVLLNIRPLKTNTSQEWERSLSHTISAAQSTADRVFRGLSEDPDAGAWNPSLGTSVNSSLDGICQTYDGESQWPIWKGIHAGLERLSGQLLTVHSFLTYHNPTPVALPVSNLVGLIDRILSALPPSRKSSKEASPGTQTKPGISRDEREAVWAYLPSLHVSALKILEQLVVRLEEASVSFDQQLLNYTIWTFEHEHSYMEIRRTVYRILSMLLARCRPGVNRSVAAPLTLCLRKCCEDLLAPQPDLRYPQGNLVPTDVAPNQIPINTDAYLKGSDAFLNTSSSVSGLQEEATSLIATALEHLPSGILPFSVRSNIDRTAVLARSKPILVSSVLNPPARRGRKQRSSVMPFLARQFPQCSSTEALLRPRMPPLQFNATDYREDSDEESVERGHDTQETAQLSPEAIGNFTEGDLRTDLESGRPETLEVVLDRGESFLVETQPSFSDRQMSEAHGPEAVLPAKRTRERESERLDETVADGPKQPLPPSSEPERKRMRDGDRRVYAPPIAEDELPPPAAPVPLVNAAPLSADIPVFAESIANLQTSNWDMDDNDSDDSSIPPIDPTMDTEEEDDENYYDTD